ncbi:hypothetical protein AAGG74_15310 [Bacillus mexicanus]|uniref:hypothetical protein n=1 Tax=Bacillus mexicanus TaxID=2834415 RepID=UPI003D2452F7
MYSITTISRFVSKGNKEEHFFGMISKDENGVGTLEAENKNIQVRLYEELSQQNTNDLKAFIRNFNTEYSQFKINIDYAV